MGHSAKESEGRIAVFEQLRDYHVYHIELGWEVLA